MVGRKENMTKLKVVCAPDGDWEVIYGSNGDKIWEGHNVDSNALIAVAKYFGTEVKFYTFTDENEIDGCTPNYFGYIQGIKDQ